LNPETGNSKIILGTVQLGLPYGINNHTGRPDQAEAFRILDCASGNNIGLLDSADAYGDSIAIIGSYSKLKNKRQFKVISKFTGDGQALRAKLTNTLHVLGRDRLYAYMFHRFEDYESGKYRVELLQLREENKIEKLGVSIYSLSELTRIIDDPDISIIQIPLHPLDASPGKKILLQEAKDRGMEIHVRSVFWQGLFFKKPEELTGNLKELRPALRLFHDILAEYRLEVRNACLNYCLHQPFLDYCIIGVETEAQLIQNVQAIMPAFPMEINEKLESIQVDNAFLLNPTNWKA
jgi:aryl-alcohol dehydrogenase-like predicted oxidoreductase